MNNITFIENGDIFDSECETLVCPVNCVGVMSKGLALEFKKRFPDACEEYKYQCDIKYLTLGTSFMYNTREHQWIYFFPTKNHWKEKSNIKSIELGLERLFFEEDSKLTSPSFWKEYNKIKSLAIPALGCGLGGLEWEEVKPIMMKYLSQLDIPVEIYEPLKEVKKK